ncbi:MAG TPA: protein-disulfide reductase DsbD family protein, partial [Myxococcota bacterium]|nr:protein-disulfide reductase DsbD family protein [Myxococcota bacterium]
MIAPVRASLAVGLLVAQPAWAEGGAPGADFSKLEASARATPPAAGDKAHPVVARLLFDQAEATAGGTVKVGVHLEQAPEWHTYWKSPGDIGLPTTIAWKLPDGFEAGPQLFPVPERYDAEGLVSYGYHPEVLHMAELRIPAGAAPGPVTVEADVDWLVCKTSCIPGHVHLAGTLTIGAASKPSPYAPLFAHYAERLPTPPDKVDALDVRAVVGCQAIAADGPFRAAFEIKARDGHKLGAIGPTPWPTFTPIAGQDWLVTGVELKPQADGLIVVVDATALTPDPLPARDAVGALVQVQVDGAWVRTEPSTPLAWAPKGTACVASDDPIWARAGVKPDVAGAAAPAP